MTTDDDTHAQTAARVEGRLRKAEQLERDKRAAWSEIEADKARIDANMARLKALRLAKEQAEASAALAEKQAKAPAKRRKPAATP